MACHACVRRNPAFAGSHAGLAALALIATSLAAPAALAQDADFYRGRSVEIVIGYPPGGSNDVYSRLLAQFMGENIPGNPKLVARNMPGAGSFVAANYVYALAPKDGTVIAIAAPTLALDERLGNPGAKYRTADFAWIGRINSLVNIVFTRKGVASTLQDAMAREVTLAGTGAGSTVSIYPTVVNNVLGTKFKLVMGYQGSHQAMLAVERGEVEGHSTGWEAVKTAHPDWLRDKSIDILAQFGLKRHAEMPDVPTAVELAKTEEDRRVLAAIMNASEIGISYFSPPGSPPQRVETLRAAFAATMRDAGFLQQAERAKLGVAPMSGADVQALVGEVGALDDKLLARVRSIYAN